MKLKELKKGDKIKILWGHGLSSAKVLENYPDKEMIYLRVNFGLWGLIGEKVIRSYYDYNFELLRQ